jgi:hypothetical protein
MQNDIILTIPHNIIIINYKDLQRNTIMSFTYLNIKCLPAGIKFKL